MINIALKQWYSTQIRRDIDLINVSNFPSATFNKVIFNQVQINYFDKLNNKFRTEML